MQQSNPEFESVLSKIGPKGYLIKPEGIVVRDRITFVPMADLRDMTYDLLKCIDVKMQSPMLSNTTFDHFGFKNFAPLEIIGKKVIDEITNGPVVRKVILKHAERTPIAFFDRMTFQGDIKFDRCWVANIQKLNELVHSLNFHKCYEVPGFNELPPKLMFLTYTATDTSYPMMQNPLHLMMLDKMNRVDVDCVYEPVNIVVKGWTNRDTIYDVASSLIDAGYDKEASL